MHKTIILILALAICTCSFAEIISVGSGSYTTTHPGHDAAGRNLFPTGTPQLSGQAVGKPVPTNDWWSLLLKENHVSNLFTYPFTLKTIPQGLVVSYIPQGVIDDMQPIIVGIAELNANKTTVADYTDWTVTMDWNDNTQHFQAIAGIAMPFLYFKKHTTQKAQITVNTGTVTISGEMILIENAKHKADFVVYAPQGSTWQQQGNTYTSDLNGKNYWSLAFVPLTATNLPELAQEYKQYAYVFPTNTTANYTYNPQTAVVTTQFKVSTQVMEGTHSSFLQGLLPHQWANLAPTSEQPQGYSYASIRGEIKTLAANQFTVQNTFYGILPTLPTVTNLSQTYNEANLNQMIDAIKDDQIGLWTDSYNDGQLLNRLIQTARIAHEIGNTPAHTTLLNTIKQRIENWLKAENGEVAFLFYYHQPWTALLAYPAGHGQDSNLNDHHFHWGYFIHAAAFVEQYQPGWAAQWGNMLNLLIRDAASNNRTDTLFPYLRNFSPFAGHCWANGFATFPNGNDQESTSESMQFNSSLIHWGTITGNNDIRDLGIYLYTTEQTAIEEYWFDVHQRNFPASQQYCLISRLWGNNFDNGTFWTNDIAASYGIELYPIHGGSLYLAHNPNYTAKLWNEIKQNTGITQNQANDNLWHDIMWQLAAFVNPTEALLMQNSYPNRNLKFGVSDAQTYYWLHAMQGLGKLDATIAATHPIAAVFNRSGRYTYVAQNYSAVPITVNYTDGYVMQVPPYTLHYQQVGELLPDVTITTPQNNTKYMLGQTATITATATDYSGATISQVDFYANNTHIGTVNTPPYQINFAPIAGTYNLTAKATNSNNQTATSQAVTVLFTDQTNCNYTTNLALQGNFSIGYKATFETTGTDVHIAFQLLDTDKNDVVAYLWQQNPFAETTISHRGEQIFTTILSNQVLGTQLSLACKFAYAGGMAVTQYFNYTVGDNCANTNTQLPNTTPAQVYTTQGVLHILQETPQMLNIYTLSGTTIYSSHTPPPHFIINLSAGVYMAQVGNTTHKIIIQ